MVIREVANRYLPESLSYAAQLLASWEFNYRVNPLITTAGLRLSESLDPRMMVVAPRIGSYGGELDRVRGTVGRLTEEEIQRAEDYVRQANERAMRYRGSNEERMKERILNVLQGGGTWEQKAETMRMLNDIRYGGGGDLFPPALGGGDISPAAASAVPPASFWRELGRGFLSEYFIDLPPDYVGDGVVLPRPVAAVDPPIPSSSIPLDDGSKGIIDRLSDIL